MSTATLPGRGVKDTAMVAASINNKIAKIRVPRFKRRGSLLRREALERLQQGKGAENTVVDEDVGDSHGEGKRAVDGRGALVGDVQMHQRPMDGTMNRAAIDSPPPQRKGAWGDGASATPRLQHQTQRRRSSTIDATATDISPAARGETGHPSATARSSSVGSDIGVPVQKQRRQSKAGSQERPRMLQGRRMSRRRDSSLRNKELEQTAVSKVEGEFRKLYVPPLGPLDDPPGTIYLDGDLTEKTVDVQVLDSLGEDVQVARKELFDLGTKRRSLVEEIRSQNRRVSRGFPRNPAAETVHEKKVEDADNARQKVESKLNRLLEHRRRLLDILQASQNDEDQPLPITLAEVPATASGATEGGEGASRPRRSSLDDMKELAKELMAREPTKEDLPPRKVDTADRPRRPSHSTRSYGKSSATGALLREETRRTKRRLINQGWREVFEAVFAGTGERRRHVVSFGQGTTEDDRERKECNIRGFMAATTPREHVEFLVAAMNPARAKDLPSVVKCLLLHYTGPAADDLDLLLGGRMGAIEVQVLTELTLSALDEMHAIYVPPILMLQWLLARAPHLRALLLRGSVLRRAFRRLQDIEAKGFGSGDRAIQYGALSLVMGVLFS